MLAFQQEHDACALGVERGRDVEDGLVDDFLDLGVRDRRGVGDGVVGAARLDGFEEGGRGRHSGGG